jgi:hypothetical protein
VSELRAGDLTERIALRIWSDIPNSAFGIDQNFSFGQEFWCKHESVHGLNIRAGMQTGEAPTDLFFIRSGSGTKSHDITGSHVVEWRGRRYRVMDTISVGAQRNFTRITAKDLGAI